MNFEDIEDSEFQHILVFGPPKSGKSVLVGQLAKHFKLKWCNLDGGVKALRKNLEPQYHKNIDVLNFPDSKAFPVAVEAMLRIFTGANCKFCTIHGVHMCQLCTRSAGENTVWNEFNINKMASDEILVIDHAAQLASSALNFITKGKGDDYKPDWDDWAKLGNILDRIFSHIQTGAYNCCVITHEMGIEMEDGKEKLMPVCGTRNYSRTFAKFFDHVVYSELFNKHHKFSSSTTAALNILTGSRANVALEKSDTPELYQMFLQEPRETAQFLVPPTVVKPATANGAIAAQVLASLSAAKK